MLHIHPLFHSFICSCTEWLNSFWASPRRGSGSKIIRHSFVSHWWPSFCRVTFYLWVMQVKRNLFTKDLVNPASKRGHWLLGFRWKWENYKACDTLGGNYGYLCFSEKDHTGTLASDMTWRSCWKYLHGWRMWSQIGIAAVHSHGQLEACGQVCSWPPYP